MRRFEILNQVRKLNKSSQQLRVLSKDDKLSFDKTKEIQEEQNKVFKKLSFYKGLLKAMDGGRK